MTLRLDDLTLDERSLVALYRGTTRAETLANLNAVPVNRIDPALQERFRSARRKVHNMTDEAFAVLDFWDVLVAEEEE